MITQVINFFVNMFRDHDVYDREILRWAKSEYKMDWQHAYQALIRGEKPQQ